MDGDDDDWRIDHTGIGVADISRAARFYDAALGALNMRAIMHITKTFQPATADAKDFSRPRSARFQCPRLWAHRKPSHRRNAGGDPLYPVRAAVAISADRPPDLCTRR